MVAQEQVRGDYILFFLPPNRKLLQSSLTGYLYFSKINEDYVVFLAVKAKEETWYGNSEMFQSFSQFFLFSHSRRGRETMFASVYYLEYNCSSSLYVFHECIRTSQCFSESSVSSSSPGSGPSSPNNGPTGNVTENETSVLPPTPQAEVRRIILVLLKVNPQLAP